MFNKVKELPLWQQWLWMSAAGGTTVWLLLSVVGIGSDVPWMIATLAVWVGQWLLLRGHVRGAGWWVLVSVSFGFVGTIMGIAYGGRLQDAIDGVPSSPPGVAGVGPGRSYFGYYAGQAVAGALAGTVLGFGQWLVLRRTFRRAGWWVSAKAVGFLAGGLVDALLPVVGVITGIALRWLLKVNYQETPTTTAPKPRVAAGWGFYLQWVWLTVLGFAVGSDIGNAMARPIPERLQDVRNLIGWFGNGACVGAAQWILLRRAVATARWWVVASAVGWAMGILLFVPGLARLNGLLAFVLVLATAVDVENFPFELFDNPFGGAVAGASIGVLQWLLLRREVVAAGWWVLASALGWAVAYLAPWAGPSTLRGATTLGLVIGSLTGIVLVWLLRRPRRGIQERSMV